MQSQEFCYWLQGSFELNETTEFDSTQTQIIKQHLDLVFQYDKKPNGFCNFLKGYFTLANPQVLDTEVTSSIRQQLSTTFKNEIDPTYPEHKKLNEVHNGGGRSLPPGVEAMC
jgi:hypothetical protein